MSLSLGLSWEFLAEWFFRMNELLASHSYHKDPIFSLCWNNFEDLPCCWLGIFCLLFFFTFFLVPLIFLSYLSWWFTLWDLFSDFWTVYMISYKLILFFIFYTYLFLRLGITKTPKLRSSLNSHVSPSPDCDLRVVIINLLPLQ